MQFKTMNIDALHKAAELAVGTQGAEVIAKLYLVIDHAMQTAYNEGHLHGSEEVNEASEILQGIAYDEGYAEGSEAFNDDAINDAFDNGYLDGVRDQEKGIAQPLVEAIMAERAAQAAAEAYDDAFNETPQVHEHAEGAEAEFKIVDLNG
jgi:hypothetical protein